MVESAVVIGAGLAGLVCADRLADSGLAVTVLDKGRGPAGRASTRRIRREDLPSPVEFDHGAQYFTVCDERFRRRVEVWLDAGVAALWRGRIVSAAEGRDPGGTDRYVGVPGMSALGRSLARGLDVRWGVRAVEVQPVDVQGAPDRRWMVRTGEGREAGPFDAAVVATPAPQAAGLLQGASLRLAGIAEGHCMLPCWAVMAAFRDGVPVSFDGAFQGEGPLSWVARNSSKPGRSDRPESWVLHAGAEWSEAELETDVEAVEARLLDAFFRSVGVEPRPPALLRGHRWRWARSREPRRDGCLAGADGSLVLAGDWLAGDRVEGAFLSGWLAAGRLLGRGASVS